MRMDRERWVAERLRRESHEDLLEGAEVWAKVEDQGDLA